MLIQRNNWKEWDGRGCGEISEERSRNDEKEAIDEEVVQLEEKILKLFSFFISFFFSLSPLF